LTVIRKIPRAVSRFLVRPSAPKFRFAADGRQKAQSLESAKAWAMQIRSSICLMLALVSVLFGLAGCSAPMGPIGGADLNGKFMHCCHYKAPSTCEDSDPQIVPPHSNFHPLPTRPVFSSPAAIAGMYAPLPSTDVLPHDQPVQPLEVQASPHKSDEPPPPPRATVSSPEAVASKNLTLRR
jgi:hypothetical protein